MIRTACRYILIILLSTLSSLYLFEYFLVYSAKKFEQNKAKIFEEENGKKYESRSKIVVFNELIKKNPKQPSCLKNIGLIYEKRGRYAEQNGDLDQRDIWFDKAAEVWSKAVRLYPGGYLDIENWLKNSGRSSIDMYL